jgi:hypothetical protein
MPLSSAAIAHNVDQIVFDARRGLIYCARAVGLISFVRVGDQGFGRAGDVRVPAGAHTPALDSSSRAIRISYGTLGHDFLMKLAPVPESQSS